MNHIAKNIVYLRKALGVTQAGLAACLKKGQSSVANWENDVSSPNADDLLLIYRFFGVSIQELILADLEKTNPVTHEFIKRFRQKTEGKATRRSNPVVRKSASYLTAEHRPSTVQEPEEPLSQTVVQLLKQIAEKLDAVRAGVERLQKERKQ